MIKLGRVKYAVTEINCKDYKYNSDPGSSEQVFNLIYNPE